MAGNLDGLTCFLLGFSDNAEDACRAAAEFIAQAYFGELPRLVCQCCGQEVFDDFAVLTAEATAVRHLSPCPSLKPS